MTAITITDLNNAKLDVDHIAEMATSLDPTCTDRLGNVKQTMAAAGNAVALTAAGSATTARIAAEAARDAAIIGAGVYTTEALGRAAVADGAAFKVQGTGDVAAYEYRRVNAGTVSTLIASYPASATVAALRTKAVSLLFTRTGFIGLTGAFTNDSTWRSTELIPLNNIQVGDISLSGHTNASTIAFYDSGKAFISGVSSPTTGVPVTNYPAPPAGAVYVSFTTFLSDIPVNVFSIETKLSAVAESSRVALLEVGIFNADLAYQATLVGFITTTGTTPNTDTNWLYSDYVPFAPGNTLTADMVGHTAVSSVSFYTDSKVFISGVSAASVGGRLVQVITAPATTAYYRICYANPAAVGIPEAAAGSRVRFSKDAGAAIAVLEVASAPLPGRIAAVESGDFKYNYASVATIPGRIGLTGLDVGTDVNWLRSGFIGIAAGKPVTCYMVGHTTVNCISFYDSNKVFLSGVAASSSALPGALLNQSVIAPLGAMYFRISFGNPATYVVAAGVITSVALTKNVIGIDQGVTDLKGDVLTLQQSQAWMQSATYASMRKLKLLSTDKVLLYGDSISSTDYPWYKSSMEALTGAVVYNGGFSGHSAASLAANAQMQLIYDYGARLVIAMIGGNDTGAAGTVGTFNGSISGEVTVAESSIAGDYVGTYFIQSVSHIIRKFQVQYSNIRTRAALTGSETEAEKTAKIDAVLKPVLVFATTLPQKRNNSGDEFSQAANWKRKRDAVVECCAKYKVDCIDLYTKIPWDMAAEPYWVSPTVKTVNNGVYMMDGLHPNKYGYQIISEIVCAEIGL